MPCVWVQGTVQYSAVQCSTVQYSAVQYSSWLERAQLAMREPWAHGHGLQGVQLAQGGTCGLTKEGA
jgi:hypothetical protein